MEKMATEKMVLPVVLLHVCCTKPFSFIILES